MKTKILLLIIAMACGLTSCHKANNEEWQEHHDKECAAHITKFNYEGHSYLLYENNFGNASTAGITHDANCHCYNIPDSDFD